MATNLRRNPNAANENMAKFLYHVCKQLDLRSIDWNKVAEDMAITNGHAARMRYSRFKQQMEGTYQTVRRPSANTGTDGTANGKTKGGGGGTKTAGERRAKKLDVRRKAAKLQDEDEDETRTGAETVIKPEDKEDHAYVKEEDEDDDQEECVIKPEPMDFNSHGQGYGGYGL